MGTGSKELAAYQADVVKALGHPLRIQIVNYLKGRQRPVADIIEHFQADPSNISRHLAILRRAGILSARKQGLSVHYRLAIPRIADLLAEIGAAISKSM